MLSASSRLDLVALAAALTVSLKTLFKNYSQINILNGFPFRRRDPREAQDFEVTTPHDGQRQLIIEVTRQ
jgi:hypothetical protein